LHVQQTLPRSMYRMIDDIAACMGDKPKLISMFRNCYTNTYLTTMERLQDDTTFIITGDIPAMWLRDSTSQVRPYLSLAGEDQDIASFIKGVIRRQMVYIVHDPYANAFNKEPNGNCENHDQTDMTAWIWERKYEVDSLCYPLQLAYMYWKVTGDTDHFDDMFWKAVRTIVNVWTTEQHHEEKSQYRFQRTNCPPSDTLPREGLGAPVAYTGMTWSGFRPSDDACQYGYLIPSNMFAVVVLKYVAEIATQMLENDQIAEQCHHLTAEIDNGIQTYGTIEHPVYGRIYAYETDGYGHYNLMDDANVPSLLSIPYIGYCGKDDEIYQNTRAFLLSMENPYFYKGKVAEGIGSPHTPEQYIWHIALSIQGLTSDNLFERQRLLDMLEATDAATHFMHEGFHVDDPTQFTRPWFSWANMMFCEFIMDCCGVKVHTTA